MSETPGGPDWWQASDGKWYPPSDGEPPTAPDGWAAPSSSPLPPPYQAGTPYQPYQPYPPAPPGGQGGSGMATASLVLGIVGIATFLFCGLGALLGLLAVIFGAVSLSNARKAGGAPWVGRARAGLITGIVALVLGIGFLVVSVVISATTEDDDFGGINSDPSDGICNEERFLQDPDC